MSNSFVGRTINNRYRLESILGDGGMGAVYRALDANLQRQVALKLMHAHFARRQEFQARLIQEARTAAQLDHPSVVNIYDFGDSPEGLFIAMEYIDGGSLREHLRRLQTIGKYLPLSQSLQIAWQMADALDYAHRKGIVHRDVKPGNIILKRISRPDTPDQQPFRAILTDFGLVKLQEEGGYETAAGTTVGTPAYMAPEQCEGSAIDGRTDLYALGIVLYELITNKLPFNVKTLSEALGLHTRGEMPPPARQIRADVPAIIDAILTKALAKNPDDRFQDGEQFATALKDVLVALKGDETRPMPREEADILEQVNEPPPGYQLYINTPGHSASVVPLTRAVISLGRNADNDIVLPAEGVSRYHARLRITGLGWEVVDLGGVNGTWLDDKRLPANEAAPLLPGSRIGVGPYELVLHAPEIQALTEEPTPAPVLTPTGGLTAATLGATQAPPLPGQEPLGLFLSRDTVSVDPGQRVDIKVEVVNRTNRDDRVGLRVEGIPTSWVVSPGEFVTVAAGKTIAIQVTIQPPRQRNTPTGRQRVRLSLISQQHSDLKLAVTANLILGTFVAFEARMEPDEIRLPDMVTVSVQNTGNSAANFSVVARARQGGLKFQGEKGRVRLEPGQTALVELEISAQQQSFFGDNELYPFDVEVVSRTGGRQTLSGSASTGPAIPMGVLYALLFVVTFFCVIAGLVFMSSRFDLFAPAPTATPTRFVTPTIDPNATVPGFELTSTAVALTATAEPNIRDTDNDGLSDAQELVIGTDPNNPDSDYDRLIDGDEVLKYVTDPLDDDTDADFLPDGEEVLVYRSDPRNPDTSGDGILDGVAVSMGLDPLKFNATTTPTATNTVTGTPPPTDTPTNTPTITNTPPPEATVTPTSSPTMTPTATDTPFPTLTPTITPTPTNTPIPVPVTACVSQPPLIDGVFQITEWPNQLVRFSPPENPGRLAEVYLSRDNQKMYMAFLINDDSVDMSDSLRIYFDTTNNEGDPDTADRFFQIGRDGSQVIWAGIGSNSDGLNWDNYTSNNWTAAIGESAGNQWVVEMEIDIIAEMGALANPYGKMIQVLYTGDIATFPLDGLPNSATTWQNVENPACPVPSQ